MYIYMNILCTYIYIYIYVCMRMCILQPPRNERFNFDGKDLIRTPHNKTSPENWLQKYICIHTRIYIYIYICISRSLPLSSLSLYIDRYIYIYIYLFIYLCVFVMYLCRLRARPGRCSLLVGQIPKRAFAGDGASGAGSLVKYRAPLIAYMYVFNILYYRSYYGDNIELFMNLI